MKEQTMELVERVRESELADASSQLDRIARLVRETDVAIEQARQHLRAHDQFVRERSRSGITSNELMSARHQRAGLEEQLEGLTRQLEQLHSARSRALAEQQEAARRFQRHQHLRERHKKARAAERASTAQRQLDEQAGYRSWLETNGGGGPW